MCKSMEIKNLLVISSKDRMNQSDTSSSFTVQFNEAIRFDKLAFVGAYIPNTIYNITSSNNLVYFNDGANRIATIPSGNYDVSTLSSAIQTQMNSVSALTFTVSYSPMTYKMTITGTAPYSLTFGTNTTNSIAKKIGFANLNTTPALSQTGNNAVQLNKQIMYINIKELVSIAKTSSNIIYNFAIPINANSNEVIQYYENTAFKQEFSIGNNMNLNTISFELRDEDNQLINFNGAELVLYFTMIKMSI